MVGLGCHASCATLEGALRRDLLGSYLGHHDPALSSGLFLRGAGLLCGIKLVLQNQVPYESL